MCGETPIGEVSHMMTKERCPHTCGSKCNFIIDSLVVVDCSTEIGIKTIQMLFGRVIFVSVHHLPILLRCNFLRSEFIYLAILVFLISLALFVSALRGLKNQDCSF